MGRRRWLAAGCAAMVLAACAPAPAHDQAAAPREPRVTAPTPTTLPPEAAPVQVMGTVAVAPPPAISPTAPGTVLIVGDSGMVDLAPALEASFSAAGVGRVVNSAWPGFGLTRPEFDWRTEWRTVVARERPDLVVVMLGGWDLRYMDAHGFRAYGRIVNEALEVLMAEGARVEWLAMLPGGGNYLSPVNSVYLQVRDWSRSVDFFDAQDVLRSPDGAFRRTVQTMEGDLLVRKPDNWHFCPDGAELVAASVTAHLATLGWMPMPAPGWEDGGWRARPDIYDDPEGACDPIAF